MWQLFSLHHLVSSTTSSTFSKKPALVSSNLIYSSHGFSYHWLIASLPFDCIWKREMTVPLFAFFSSTTNLSFAFYSIQVLAHWPYYLVISLVLLYLSISRQPVIRQVCREILEKTSALILLVVSKAPWADGAPLRSNEPVFIALGSV